MRIHIIRNIILASLALVAFDLFYLQVIRGGYFFRQSEGNSIRAIPFEGKRGRILDRNGKILADNDKSFCVAIIPQDQKDRQGVFAFLEGILDVDADELQMRFSRNRRTPFSPVVVAEDLTRQQAILIEEGAFKYPGLLVMERYRRHYPSGSAGAHVVGYVGKADEARMRLIQDYGYSADEPVGYAGVEFFYDEDLRSEPGGRQIQVDSRGRQVRLLSVREPSAGKDLVLTVDQDMQRMAQEVVGQRRGALVAMDPANGEILAAVSAPSFDPNDFSSREDRAAAGSYLRDVNSPLLNRVVMAQFPPGSVFKIPVALAGLQERKIKPATTINCPGYFDLGNRHFKFAHAFGSQDLFQAMAHSANEYFFTVGLSLGADQIAHYAALLALGERTGIDLPYEVKGAIPKRKTFTRWFPGDTANMSIGQGYVLTTPIQLARLMATVENEGRIVVPHVKKSWGGVDNAVPFTSSRFVALRPEVWAGVKQALRQVVKMDTGTAHALDLPGLEVYGKTGTAQAGTGRGDHAWFAGVAKTSQRTLVIAVLFEHGGYSTNAVEAAKEFILALQSQGKI